MAKPTEKRAPTVQEQQRYEKRRAVVEAVQRWDAVRVVARVFGVAVRSVFDWLAWYRQGAGTVCGKDGAPAVPPKSPPR